jgi:hypothetical protein
MKRWGLVWIVAILSCIPILLNRASSPELLADTDTAFLLRIINERDNPLSWFTGDWPLLNHFYRPISTLAFEFDNAVHPNDPAGFGLTNALLCVACIMLVCWVWRELTDSIPLTLGATALFGLWHWNNLVWVAPVLFWASLMIGFFGLFRHGFKVWFWLPAVAALNYLAYEADGLQPLYFRMIAWLPGRTASVMTVFCLFAIAGYARYERLSATRLPVEPTSMDEPAGTRSSVLSTQTAKAPWSWAVLSVLACALALGSYEQAVMLPAALVGVAVSLRLRRYRVRWGWQVAFWGLLVLYFVARKVFLPEGTSGYQLQQFRSGPGVWFSILAYVAPSLSSLFALYKSLDLGFALLYTTQVYSTIWNAYMDVSAFLAARRHWVLALTGFALSVLAYLPMAWLNQFDHYHYWPMAMRSLFVVVLAWGVWELCVTAVSPPATQAPPRPAPAPGSLPHP